MNYKHLLLSFFLSLISISCHSQAKNVYEQVKEGYAEILSAYPKELTSHFPPFENIYIADLSYTYPGAANINSIYLTYLYADGSIKEIEEKVKSGALKEYHFTDSCSMVVGYDSTLYEEAKFRLVQCKDFANLLPTPNFDYLVESSLPSSFYENATIYVLGASEGKFLKEEELWSKGVGLSCSWKNGYTRGVVISEDITIYWLEIW